MTWFRKYGDDVQKYAALTTSEQSHKFLVDNLHLVSDHMASYLVIYCVDLEVEGVRLCARRVTFVLPRCYRAVPCICRVTLVVTSL